MSSDPDRLGTPQSGERPRYHDGTTRPGAQPRNQRHDRHGRAGTERREVSRNNPAADRYWYLKIYLNDQLALGVVWRQLARRAQRSNRDTPLGDALARVATGIAEDVETFRSLMRQAGIRPSRMKPGAAVAAERLGRLKLNGRLADYSPLSRFTELEMLTMGIEGKKQLWTTLRDLAGLATQLPDVDFDQLIERAAAQKAELEPHRVRAGRELFISRGLSGRSCVGGDRLCQFRAIRSP
ncbi:hypothetical protein SAMN05216207_108913 [Pseudonocardia ammonioxydans]|uniref:Uncharacterized protein n=1 Tax=Pseudonocardia ammonioxydans TaxID=260086 RepID=A0A1I5I884_PSUAM|nr:hypothetical protein [Pseudonocardia ammonioxydans]SFO56316.1 hypothetical protein SAMN05216207_108913 [Pseudonocardia ammonioxydans]